MKIIKQCFQSRRFWAISLALGSTILCWVVAINLSIHLRSDQAIYHDMAEIDQRSCAVVFGCARTVGPRMNLYYQARITTAAQLYHAGKVSHILVSGDNHRHGYDEPTAMADDLHHLGVPFQAITKDYAGFRTLDTVRRARDVFGLDNCVFITQRFHLGRALFIADHIGLDAVGLEARSPTAHRSYPKQLAREALARCLAWADVHLWHRQAHFPGPHEPIPAELLQ